MVSKQRTAVQLRTMVLDERNDLSPIATFPLEEVHVMTFLQYVLKRFTLLNIFLSKEEPQMVSCTLRSNRTLNHFFLCRGWFYKDVVVAKLAKQNRAF